MPNDHIPLSMDEIQMLECENCETGHPPSVYAMCLDTSPSGQDLFGVFTCPQCGAVYGVAFDGAAFMAWWNAEQLILAREGADEDERDHQRWKSALGREVANFRRELENVATVEDCWTA